MLSLGFETIEDTPLPEHVKEKLVEAGFDTPVKVLEAEDKDLLAIPGIGRKMLGAIRSEVRTDLDRALDRFRAIAELYHKSFRSEYPKHAVVLHMQNFTLTVGDFLELHAALNPEE